MWHASVWSDLHIILTQILCNYNLLIWNTDAEERFILIFQIAPPVFLSCSFKYLFILTTTFSRLYQISQLSFINTFINTDRFMGTHRHSWIHCLCWSKTVINWLIDWYISPLPYVVKHYISLLWYHYIIRQTFSAWCLKAAIPTFATWWPSAGLCVW